LKHHKYVQQPEDPDLVLSNPFPVSKDSMRRKIIRDLTGQTFFKQRIAPLFVKEGEGLSVKHAQVLTSDTGVREHLLLNLGLFLLLAVLGIWWVFPVIWVVAMATWLPFITRIRNIGEHAAIPDSDDPLAHARTTHAAWWERLFLAPYWVHYHIEHHAFMHLPCYRLKGVHEALIEKGYGPRMRQASSYAQVLREATTTI